MKRRAALINRIDKLRQKFLRDFTETDIKRVEFYVDVENKKDAMEIYNVLSKNKPKFVLIVYHILKGITNKTIYNNEPHGLKAMKFRNSELNTRVYCKEIKGKDDKKLKVVMVKAFLNKTTQENNKEIKQLLEKISNYNYEFFQTAEEARKHRA